MKTNQTQAPDPIFTVPNLLSALRIALAILFCVLFDSTRSALENWMAFSCLGLNALSDCVDGKISRALNQISELGKVLDPVADYLTKFSLILCFLQKYPMLMWFLMLFFLRVFLVVYFGWKTVRQVGENQGAIFAGKADTVIFYAVMLSLVAFPDMPVQLAYAMVSLSGVTMVGAMIQYLRHFHRLRERKT